MAAWPDSKNATPGRLLLVSNAVVSREERMERGQAGELRQEP